MSVGIDAAGCPRYLGLAAAGHGCGVVDTVGEPTGVEAGLKWPNDVLAGGGKLAGILAEVAAPSR